MDKPTLVVIGGGPGGYEAAIEAAKLGAQVTVVEKDELGGTCLHRGCIPTKDLLGRAEEIKRFETAKKAGINTGEISLDLETIHKNKNKKIDLLKSGIQNKFDELGIELIKGTGSLKDSHTVLVKTDNNELKLKADKILLATGSKPILPKNLNFDGIRVLTSEELLSLTEIPESAVLIGANIIGCELGQYLSRFGTKVTLVEAKDRIVPGEDEDIVRVLQRALKREKIKFLTKTRVETIDKNDSNLTVHLSNGKEITTDLVVICVGRVARSDELNLEEIGIELQPNGQVNVNQTYQTTIDSIYAIGDLVADKMLAHVASQQGILVAHYMFDEDFPVREERSVPKTLFTEPEIASVGYTEQELLDNSLPYKKGSVLYRELGKAHTLNKIDGFFKILTDPDDVIIGASIIGERASELISELTVAIDYGLTATQIADVIHPHPTLSEGIRLACLAVRN